MALNRSPMYFLFIGIQHALLIGVLIGFFAGPMKRNLSICADQAGLLMVQITACTDIGVKGFVLLIAMWKDRFNMPAEMIGKPIGCFITVFIYFILSIIFVIVGSVTIKKSAYYLFLQGLSFANEGAFHLYNRFAYK